MMRMKQNGKKTISHARGATWSVSIVAVEAIVAHRVMPTH
jgi:hypothetical protein